MTTISPIIGAVIILLVLRMLLKKIKYQIRIPKQKLDDFDLSDMFNENFHDFNDRPRNK